MLGNPDSFSLVENVFVEGLSFKEFEVKWSKSCFVVTIIPAHLRSWAILPRNVRIMAGVKFSRGFTDSCPLHHTIVDRLKLPIRSRTQFLRFIQQSRSEIIIALITLIWRTGSSTTLTLKLLVIGFVLVNLNLIERWRESLLKRFICSIPWRFTKKLLYL